MIDKAELKVVNDKEVKWTKGETINTCFAGKMFLGWKYFKFDEQYKDKYLVLRDIYSGDMYVCDDKDTAIQLSDEIMREQESKVQPVSKSIQQEKDRIGNLVNTLGYCVVSYLLVKYIDENSVNYYFGTDIAILNMEEQCELVCAFSNLIPNKAVHIIAKEDHAKNHMNKLYWLGFKENKQESE